MGDDFESYPEGVPTAPILTNDPEMQETLGLVPEPGQMVRPLRLDALQREERHWQQAQLMATLLAQAKRWDTNDIESATHAVARIFLAVESGYVDKIIEKARKDHPSTFPDPSRAGL